MERGWPRFQRRFSCVSVLPLSSHQINFFFTFQKRATGSEIFQGRLSRASSNNVLEKVRPKELVVRTSKYHVESGSFSHIVQYNFIKKSPGQKWSLMHISNMSFSLNICRVRAGLLGTNLSFLGGDSITFRKSH